MKNSDSKNAWKCGADLVVAQLEQQGVKHVFGIPGAKIDRVFDSLVDSSIVTIPVRHEANAAFMAGAVGRLTSKAGVATATSEGDPLVAIGGAVKRADHVKQVHQTMDTVSMFRPVTKFAAEVTSSSALSEVLANGFRAAEFGRPGASFISLPMDIINEPAQGRLLSSHSPTLGSAPHDAIRQVSACLKKAKRPVLLLGLMASQPRNAEAIRRFLNKSDLPVTSTYQAAGVIEQAHFHRFAGRVGLFNNQAGDRLLRNADLVITVGYSPVEYEPAQWSNGTAELVHIDVVPAETDSDYTPDVELVGDIADTLDLLTEQVHQQFTLSTETLSILDDRRQQRELLAQKGRSLNQFAIHPLRLVRAMQDIVNSDVTLCVDMGSFHIWIARYLYSFRARQVLISNGQQTMGVALPWAIGAALVEPGRKVVSVSGDGGFMQSSMELETAVRLGVNLLHIIWVDDCYNMVAIQEEKKYQRTSGVKFGPIDFKAYAEAFGAKGFAVTSSDTLESTLRAAMDVQGPAVVAVPVDYSDNALLMGQLNMGEMF